MSLKMPKPVRSTVLGSNCQAIAVRGCRIASGVDDEQIAEAGLDRAFSG